VQLTKYIRIQRTTKQSLKFFGWKKHNLASILRISQKLKHTVWQISILLHGARTEPIFCSANFLVSPQMACSVGLPISTSATHVNMAVEAFRALNRSIYKDGPVLFPNLRPLLSQSGGGAIRGCPYFPYFHVITVMFIQVIHFCK
jgi:hypothetical protein